MTNRDLEYDWVSLLLNSHMCSVSDNTFLPIALLQSVNSFMTLGVLLRLARCFGPIPGRLISVGWCNPAWNTSLSDSKLQLIPVWEGEMVLLGQLCLFSVYWSRTAWLHSSIGYKWTEWWQRSKPCYALHMSHTQKVSSGSVEEELRFAARFGWISRVVA